MTDNDREKVSRSDCTPWRDEETVRHFYYGKQYSIGATARTLGCTRACMTRRMDKMGFDKRSISEQKRLESPSPLKDKELLRKLYVEEEKSTTDVAKELGVSQAAVLLWLDRHGIGARNLQEAQWLRGPPKINDKETLEEMYIGREMSANKIAEELDTSGRAVRTRLHSFGIDVRGFGVSGEKHPAWKGGDYPGYYGPGWYEQARKCRERDKYECQMCGSDGGPRRLDVHHIIPFREFDDPEEANDLDNLVSLCRSCHRRAEVMSPLLPSGFDP